MNPKAILLTVILVSSTLAGCTSDPDGGANDEIDAETLQNLQDFINGTMEPEWINDRGDSGHEWALSLNDDQWLEVASSYAVMQGTYDGHNRISTWVAMIVSDEGFVAGSGHSESKSPLFGGNYSLCIQWSDGICYKYDRDQADHDHQMIEWSVIYRIHEVSPTNYYFNDSGPSEPPLLEHQNITLITLHVSYVPSGSDDRVYGNIVIELFPNEAPLHVESFLSLIEGTYYDFTKFHRVIDGFVIQGGDFENHDGTGGYAGGWYGYCNGESTSDPCDQSEWTIPDEANNGLLHVPGVLAMAKTSAPNTGGSQFYIVPSDSMPSHLDGIHTVFGQVVSGMEHVDAISEVDTDQNDRPVNEVRLIHASVLN